MESAALITALSHCLHSSHYQSSVSQITEVTASSLSARDHVSQMAPLCPQPALLPVAPFRCLEP